ncbi:MBOAT family O-acyltransferase [Flavihumibacter petaseus]|uniref:MBOAT family protein n=1 Tax=Flavihumibacter petaseus NBRC 106054 TaxID=1220578 RepID=A0A0E9N696_9BACT|nr:MBOAT family O-acyltransferase [Flavihumibacter petaseus]GAO45236.1 MBOAT family protein [Flavihumibacter petaseus NBRC 106054]
MKRFQVPVLIISSLIFYAFGEPGLVLLLLFSAAINIVASYYVAFGRKEYRRPIAITGVALNLLGIAFFKYSPLFAHTFLHSGSDLGQFLLNIPLPIGISFFTFEGISLLVDVWKEKYFDNRKMLSPSLSKHAQHTLFFISFFPHLVAGPILKAHDFFPQIGQKKFRDIQWESAFKSIVVGYFLKMVLADNLKDFTYWITYPYFEAHATIDLLVMLFGYSMQIFADFAGYSLIAIGLAALFGYQFQDNFLFPYISGSFKEFWKRWHISLSSFLMEYLYFPLGGNRKGKVRTYVNLMITMVLGGLWHGAAWSYAIWGMLHGLALAAERFCGDKFGTPSSSGYKFLKGIVVFLFVTFAWLLFKLPEFEHVIAYFRSMADNTRLTPGYSLISSILVYSLPVVLYHLSYLVKEKSWLAPVHRFKFAGYAIMIFLILTNSGSSGAFIYFQF